MARPTVEDPANDLDAFREAGKKSNVLGMRALRLSAELDGPDRVAIRTEHQLVPLVGVAHDP